MRLRYCGAYINIHTEAISPFEVPNECQISIPSRLRWSVPLGPRRHFRRPALRPILSVKRRRNGRKARNLQRPTPSLLSERAFISGDWGTLSCSHALRADFVPLSLSATSPRRFRDASGGLRT